MIPWVLIAVGGVMILAGIQKKSPVTIIKDILQNAPTTTPTTGGSGGTPNKPTI